jgi:hypothetical protein
MKANKVHAVIAAGLQSPALISLWREDPNQLRKCGVEPESFDFDALQKFAGLTTKVRHNGLRLDLPLTFRLLNVAGLEIELFSAYATFRAASGRGYADTTAGRAEDLLHFMEHWLDFDRREHVLLWDIMRHELALMNLTSLNPTLSWPKLSSATKIPRPADVPHIRGTIILNEMRSDPRVVGAVLQEKVPRLNEVEFGTFNFCYWREESAAAINFLHLDELGFCLLTLIDGATATATLSRTITGENKTSRGIVNALGELAELGIIDFCVTKTNAKKRAR